MFAFRENLGEILCELEWFTGIGLDGEVRDMRTAVMKMLSSVFPDPETVSSLWPGIESMTESLWVGGMLYSDEIAEKVSSVMALSSSVLKALDAYPEVEPFLGLDYSSYFKHKYHEYYSVYENAGCGNAFAPLGQKRLNEIAMGIHEREKFLDGFLSSYESLDLDTVAPEEIGALLDDFPGSDRRVELIRRLSHESDMVYGGFSTYDPRPTMNFLVEEIRRDYYGGAYVPLGEDEASYACIIPQLRERWLNR